MVHHKWQPITNRVDNIAQKADGTLSKEQHWRFRIAGFQCHAIQNRSK